MEERAQHRIEQAAKQKETPAIDIQASKSFRGQLITKSHSFVGQQDNKLNLNLQSPAPAENKFRSINYEPSESGVST